MFSSGEIAFLALVTGAMVVFGLVVAYLAATCNSRTLSKG